MWTTTLNKIREQSPCREDFARFLGIFDKTKADDEPLQLIAVLDSNGLEYALWSLRAIDGKDREIRLFAVRCARRVQHLMTDQRSIDALDVSERFANGSATTDELEAARGAALAALSASAIGARTAAMVTEPSAALAAELAATLAAELAAEEVSSNGAGPAASAARDAAMAWQERDFRAMISE